MAKLTISDAARVAGVSRVTLHRYIKAGKLSRMPDGNIDTSELMRAGFVLQLETLEDATPVTPMLHDVTPHPVTAPVTADTQAYERMIHLLQEQVQDLRGDVRHAEERERYYQERIAWLETQVGHEQQRYDRLLEAPRIVQAPVSTAVPGGTSRSGDRGDMRRRIVALLQEHPEGLSPAQIRVHLGVAKRMAHTCVAMARDGLLRRVDTGRYVACEPHHD